MVERDAKDVLSLYIYNDIIECHPLFRDAPLSDSNISAGYIVNEYIILDIAKSLFLGKKITIKLKSYHHDNIEMSSVSMMNELPKQTVEIEFF